MIKEDEIGRLQQDNLSIADVTLAVDEALRKANVDLYERKNIIDQRSRKSPWKMIVKILLD